MAKPGFTTNEAAPDKAMNENMENAELAEDEELYEHHRFVVDKGQAPLRIDKFLTERISNATRNKIAQAIESEAVKVNEESVKASYKIRPT